MTGVDSIVATRHHDAILLVQINRPQVRNALRQQDKVRLAEVVRSATRDDLIRAVIIAGSDPRAFCAGTDVTEMQSLSTSRALEMFQAEEELYRSLLESPALVIAAVDGAAMGAGCVLAACADIVIAGQDARFAMPEVRLGLPAPMQTAILPQVVGLGTARRMLLTCEVLGATEARECGLVSETTPAGGSVQRALRVGERVAAFPTPGLRLQKMLINSWLTGEYSTSVRLSPYVAAVALSEAGDELPMVRNRSVEAYQDQ